MKIIAETRSGFLLEASKDEIALVMGFRNAYDDDFKKKSIVIGAELEVNKIDQISRFVRTLEKDKLLKIKAEMQRTIDALDVVVTDVQNITLFATLSED